MFEMATVVTQAKAMALLRLWVVSSLALSVCSCERDTRVRISESKNPPTFTLSGRGKLIRFIVAGPYKTEAELNSPPPGLQAIWEISPSPAQESVSSLPAITYGKVPPGFTQLAPPSSRPPALEEGRFYSIGTPSNDAGFRRLCFKLESGQIVQAQCRER